MVIWFKRLGFGALTLVALFLAIGAYVADPEPPPSDTQAISQRVESQKAETVRTPVVQIIGDSYTSGSGEGRGLDGWPARIQGRYGIQMRSVAMGGMGYVTTDAYSRTFMYQVDKLSDANPDVILLVGSRNDASTGAGAVYEAAIEVMAEVKKRAPKVIAIGPIWDSSDPNGGAKAARDAVKRAAKDSGITFVDGLRWFAGRDDLIRDDLVHPTNEGHKVLRDRVYEVLVKAGVKAPKP